MAGDARFCSISKAAELVSKAEGQPVERSTLSRYIKRYAADIEQRREGRETLINVDALIQHRTINIRVERGSAAPYREDRRIASSKERKGEIEVRRAEIELEDAEEERARKRGEIIHVPGEGLPKPRGGRGDLLVKVTYRPEVVTTRTSCW